MFAVNFVRQHWPGLTAGLLVLILEVYFLRSKILGVLLGPVIWLDVVLLGVFLTAPLAAHYIPYLVVLLWRSGRLYFVAQKIGLTNVIPQPTGVETTKYDSALRDALLAASVGVSHFRFLGTAGYMFLGAKEDPDAPQGYGFLFNLLKDHPDADVEWVLLDPRDEDSLRARVEQANVGSHEYQHTVMRLRSRVFCTLKAIARLNATRSKLIRVFLYKSPAVFRLILMESSAFIGFYRASVGERMTVMQFRGPEDAVLDPAAWIGLQKIYDGMKQQHAAPVDLKTVIQETRALLEKEDPGRWWQ